MQATNFSLPDQAGQIHSLSDYAGRWLVLYFYPEDDTPGCTTEACAFRDIYTELENQGVAVLGVSPDSVQSHRKFAEKYHLNFPLLADPEKTVINAYEAWGMKNLYGRKFEGILRKSFLIDPTGEIAKEYKKVTPATHGEQILRDLEALKG